MPDLGIRKRKVLYGEDGYLYALDKKNIKLTSISGITTASGEYTERAGSCDTATYATTAGSASTATTADYATAAGVATTAGSASTATTADYATAAGVANTTNATLASAASASDWTIELSTAPLGEAGFCVVIEPYSTNCEMRAVTAVDGTTLTLNWMLNHDHDENTAIFFVDTRRRNILWYGAKPTAALDGSSVTADDPDCTAAIQAAIDDGFLVGNNHIYIPIGNYKVTDTLVFTSFTSSYTIMEGESAFAGYCATLQPYFSSSVPVIMCDNPSSIEFKNFSITNGDNTDPLCGMFITKNTLAHRYTAKCNKLVIGVDSTVAGMILLHCHNVHIDQCDISGGADALASIYITQSKKNPLTGTTYTTGTTLYDYSDSDDAKYSETRNVKIHNTITGHGTVGEIRIPPSIWHLSIKDGYTNPSPNTKPYLTMQKDDGYTIGSHVCKGISIDGLYAPDSLDELVNLSGDGSTIIGLSIRNVNTLHAAPLVTTSHGVTVKNATIDNIVLYDANEVGLKFHNLYYSTINSWWSNTGHDITITGNLCGNHINIHSGDITVSGSQIGNTILKQDTSEPSFIMPLFDGSPTLYGPNQCAISFDEASSSLIFTATNAAGSTISGTMHCEA